MNDRTLPKSGEALVFLVQLKNETSMDDYAEFVREVEHPILARLPSVLDQTVLYQREMVELSTWPIGVHAVDVIEVTSLDEYRDDLGRIEHSDEWSAFLAGWSRLVDSDYAMVTDRLSWSKVG